MSFLAHLGKAKALFSFSIAFRSADNLGQTALTQGDMLYCTVRRSNKSYQTKVCVLEGGCVVWDDIIKLNSTLYHTKASTKDNVEFLPKIFTVTLQKDGGKGDAKTAPLKVKLDLAQFAKVNEVTTVNSFVLLTASGDSEQTPSDCPSEPLLKLTVRARETHINSSSMTQMRNSEAWLEAGEEGKATSGNGVGEEGGELSQQTQATTGDLSEMTASSTGAEAEDRLGPSEELDGRNLEVPKLHTASALSHKNQTSGNGRKKRKETKKEKRRRIEEGKKKMSSFRRSTLKRGLNFEVTEEMVAELEAEEKAAETEKAKKKAQKQRQQQQQQQQQRADEAAGLIHDTDEHLLNHSPFILSTASPPANDHANALRLASTQSEPSGPESHPEKPNIKRRNMRGFSRFDLPTLSPDHTDDDEEDGRREALDHSHDVSLDLQEEEILVLDDEENAVDSIISEFGV